MQFHDELEASGAPPLPIVVVKHNNPLRGKIICQDWVGVRTHWWGGHTIACCGTDNCPACESQGWVKKYYLAFEGLKSAAQVLVMLTPLAAEMIVSQRCRTSGFLGCEMVVSRSAARNTSPMQAKITGFHPGTRDFGTSRLQRVVTRIFRENAHGVG